MYILKIAIFQLPPRLPSSAPKTKAMCFGSNEQTRTYIYTKQSQIAWINIQQANNRFTINI